MNWIEKRLRLLVELQEISDQIDRLHRRREEIRLELAKERDVK